MQVFFFNLKQLKRRLNNPVKANFKQLEMIFIQLPNIQKARWSHLSESNRRPTGYKSVALPAELRWRF